MNENTKPIAVASSFKHLGVGRALGEGITSGFSWVGMRGKVWSLHHEGETRPFLRADDGTPSPFLDVVIVGFNPNSSRVFYLGAYAENSSNPPDCASINGHAPDAGVPEPQSTTCGICKHNIWGSAVSGRGKACQEHKRVAVLLMPYMLKGMLEKPLLTPVFLKIPPDSLKIWKAYGESLAVRNAHWASVVTRITFNVEKQFQMVFTMKQPLTDREAPVILPLLEDPQTHNIIGGRVEADAGPPELPAPEQSTGLLEAFGEPAGPAETANKRPPGRPPGRKPAPTIEADRPSQSQGAPDPEASAFEAADPKLSERINALIGDKTAKVKGMLS